MPAGSIPEITGIEPAPRPILLVHSHFGEPPRLFSRAVERGDAVIVRELQLTRAHLAAARGLITTQHLDQIGFMAFGEEVQALLDRGGRWFFNGHILRPFIGGLGIYQPIVRAKRADLVLTRLNEHPIFAGIEQRSLEENKGVAGFYGRGHNPLPDGGLAVNGMGPNRFPVDWNGCCRAAAGCSRMPATTSRAWGAARAPTGSSPNASSPDGGRTLTMSILAINPGAYYHLESFEGERYRGYFDRLVRPEALGEVDLAAHAVVLVPCRTPADRIGPCAGQLRAYLDQGGTVIATGESESQLWLPGIAFTPQPTNFWWWLTPGADLGVRIANPEHSLFSRLSQRDVTWHLHGWFDVPEGVEVLAVNGEGKPILYVDEVTTGGRMVITSLDPFFHHGSHFMPATTRFLDGFLPWMREELDRPGAGR